MNTNMRGNRGHRRAVLTGGAAVLLGLSMLLTGCSGGDGSAANAPVPGATGGPSMLPTPGQSTAEPTPGTEISPTENAFPGEKVGDLQVPKLATGGYEVPGGDAVAKIGADTALEAFKFAAAFYYRMNVIPEVWAPAAPPQRLLLTPFGDYMAPGLRADWAEAADDIAAGKTTPTSWEFSKRMYLPRRNDDGTLTLNGEDAKGQTTIVFPWNAGTTVGTAIVQESTCGEDGQCLKVTFKMRMNVPIGDQTGAQYSVATVRTVNVDLVENFTDTKDRSPWLVSDWSISGYTEEAPVPFKVGPPPTPVGQN